jgi:hypothetical protein
MFPLINPEGEGLQGGLAFNMLKGGNTGIMQLFNSGALGSMQLGGGGKMDDDMMKRYMEFLRRRSMLTQGGLGALQR